MKTISLFLIIFIGFVYFLKADENIEKAEIKTSAVCEHCKEILETKLSKIKGIKSSDLDLETKILKVEYDKELISLDEIKDIISKTGYDADDVKRNKKAFKKLPKCCQVHD